MHPPRWIKAEINEFRMEAKDAVAAAAAEAFGQMLLQAGYDNG